MLISKLVLYYIVFTINAIKNIELRDKLFLLRAINSKNTLLLQLLYVATQVCVGGLAIKIQVAIKDSTHSVKQAFALE